MMSFWLAANASKKTQCSHDQAVRRVGRRCLPTSINDPWRTQSVFSRKVDICDINENKLQHICSSKLHDRTHGLESSSLFSWFPFCQTMAEHATFLFGASLILTKSPSMDQLLGKPQCFQPFDEASINPEYVPQELLLAPALHCIQGYEIYDRLLR